VEARWTITDPEGFVTGLGADLNLNLRDSALVDFGATSMVYAALRKDQSAEFVAAYQTSGGTSWFVDLGGQRYAAGRGLAAEGWAHVMDRERATAVAIADFAQAVPGGRDRIGASSDGRLTLRRELPRGQTKELRFWLHFVSMPVQVGAATSPQSMQSPPKVEWQ
jgi:hypothetical protein